MWEHAIQHYSNAIAIKDWPPARTSRASLYIHTGECGLAEKDAEAALAMEPVAGPRHHTVVEANIVLYRCRLTEGDLEGALWHVNIALAQAQTQTAAGENLYPPDEVVLIAAARERVIEAMEQGEGSDNP